MTRYSGQAGNVIDVVAIDNFKVMQVSDDVPENPNHLIQQNLLTLCGSVYKKTRI